MSRLRSVASLPGETFILTYKSSCSAMKIVLSGAKMIVLWVSIVILSLDYVEMVILSQSANILSY